MYIHNLLIFPFLCTLQQTDVSEDSCYSSSSIHWSGILNDDTWASDPREIFYTSLQKIHFFWTEHQQDIYTASLDLKMSPGLPLVSY